jgi:PD-(D/E)XK nuclease superfamily
MDTGMTSEPSQKGFHRLDQLMRCPRAFGFREVLHLLPLHQEREQALSTAAHAALAAHYSGHPWTEGLKDAAASWAFVVPEARLLCQAYVSNFATDPFDVLAVEYELGVVAFEEQLFTRRFDLLVKSHLDGKAYAVDHQTTSRVGQRLRTAEHDGDLFTQDVIGDLTVPAEFGLEWGGVILNLLGTQASEWTFKRVPLEFPTQILQDALASIHYWSELAESWLASGLSPWDYPQTFHCGGCDYLDLCRSGPVAEDQYAVEA